MSNEEPAPEEKPQQTPTPDATRSGVSPILVIFLVSGIMGLIAAGAMLLGERGSSTEPESDAAAAVATPVTSRPLGEWQAENFQFTSLNGEVLSLNQYRGRTVFLNMWWTGCPPCQREFPAFQQFMDEQGEDGAVVLAVNQGEDAGEIRDFLESVNVSGVPVLLDRDLSIREKYPYNAFPTTYVIGPEGRVRFRKIGEISIDDMYTYLDEVRAGAAG